MLKRISQLAENAAADVSRRECLGFIGRGAMMLAAALGGLLILPAAVRAGRPTLCSGFSGNCGGLPPGSFCEDRDGGPGKAPAHSRNERLPLRYARPMIPRGLQEDQYV
jgi:hypothetical protein